MLCPYSEICPELKKLEGKIYGRCLYSSETQNCKTFKKLEDNPSIRVRKNESTIN